MEIDVEILARQAKAQFGELMWANLVLAGQLGAAENKCADLEAELAKKPKE